MAGQRWFKFIFFVIIGSSISAGKLLLGIIAGRAGGVLAGRRGGGGGSQCILDSLNAGHVGREQICARSHATATANTDATNANDCSGNAAATGKIGGTTGKHRADELLRGINIGVSLGNKCAFYKWGRDIEIDTDHRPAEENISLGSEDAIHHYAG